jgi:hypothetical protein
MWRIVVLLLFAAVGCSRQSSDDAPKGANRQDNKIEEPRQKDEPGRKSEPTPIKPKSTDPKKSADPVVVSADTLAQAVQDDVNSAAKKYHLTELQVDGVVAKHSEFKGQVAMFQFDLSVKDRKTDKMVGFTIFCSLKDPLPKGDKRLDEFAVGKKVTIRGKSTAMGNGQVTLTDCMIVREGDKGGAKKGTTMP